MSSKEHTGVPLDFQAALANKDTMKPSAGLIARPLRANHLYGLWVSRTGAQVDVHRQRHGSRRYGRPPSFL